MPKKVDKNFSGICYSIDKPVSVGRIEYCAEQKTENQMASEAAMMYETARSMDDFVASIPVDLMQQLIDISIRDCKAGKGIRHEQIASYINEQMGWE